MMVEKLLAAFIVEGEILGEPLLAPGRAPEINHLCHPVVMPFGRLFHREVFVHSPLPSP
jgi:hypothetical protein